MVKKRKNKRYGEQVIKDIKKYKLKSDEHLIVILTENSTEFFVVKEKDLVANDFKFKHAGVSYHLIPTKNKHFFVKGDIRELDEHKLVKMLEENKVIDPFLFKKTRSLVVSEALSRTLGIESPLSKFTKANLFISLVGFIFVLASVVIVYSQVSTLKHQTQVLSQQVATLNKLVTLKNINTVPQPHPQQPQPQQSQNTTVVIPPSTNTGGGGK